MGRIEKCALFFAFLFGSLGSIAFLGNILQLPTVVDIQSLPESWQK